MSETGEKTEESAWKKIRKKAGAAGEEAAEEVKKATAKTVTEVRNRGGLGQIVEDAVAGTVNVVGQGVGYAAKGVKSVYDAAAEAITGEDEEESDDEGKGILNRVAQPFKDIGGAVAEAYEKDKTINPEAVGKKLEKGTRAVTGAVGSVVGAVTGTARKLTGGLTEYIPSPEDYKVQIGKKTYECSKKLIGPELEAVKAYMAAVDNAVPGNYKGRQKLFEIIAREGIKSNKEFDERHSRKFRGIKKYAGKIEPKNE